jgi:tryptophan synthase alpha chain
MTGTRAVLSATRGAGRSAFIGYLPAGFPDVGGGLDAAKALADAGADIIELGLPYSDPSMDGVVIQQATSQALAAGLRTRDVLATVEGLAGYAPHVAVVVMTYWNPVLRYGPEQFAADLAAAGGAGLITPDITPDYGGRWIAAADSHHLDKIFLVAPSSTAERLAMTVGACRGFVYAASLMGVTGERAAVDDAARTLVERTRAAAADTGGEANVCVGLGVSTPGQAAEVACYADGVIVGSVLVRALADASTPADGVRRLGGTASALIEAVRSARS